MQQSSRSSAGTDLVPEMAQASALAAHARNVTRGASVERLRVVAALRPGGAPGAAPQPEEAGLPLFHPHVALVFCRFPFFHVFGCCWQWGLTVYRDRLR